MTNRLKVATSGRPAFAEDYAVGGVPGNVLTRVAGPIPGAPDDVEWRPGGGGGGGGIPAPTTSHLVFVSQIFGNDVTGDGSEGKPYATIAKADSTITTASFVDQWVVVIFPGEYAENLLLKAFIRHVGYDPSAFQFATYPVRLNGNITGLDPSFTTANALASVSNMMVDGTVDLDYVTAGSADGAVAFTNVCITGAMTLNQQTTNDTELHESVLLGALTQTGGTCQAYNTSGQDPAQHMIVNGRVDGPTVFNAFGGSWAGDLHASQATVTTEDVTLNLHGFSTGAVRITAAGGKNPAVNADLGATIENPTLDGSSAAALTAGMRVFKQLIIPGGTVIAAAGTTDVTRTLPASVLGATSIEDMLCNCELTGADWPGFFTAEKLAVSWVYVNNAGTPEIHCMIHTTGAGFTLAVSLPFTFFATLPFVPVVP